MEGDRGWQEGGDQPASRSSSGYFASEAAAAAAPAVNRLSTLNGRGTASEGQPVHDADGRGARCGAAFQGLDALGAQAHCGDALENRSAWHEATDGLPCVRRGLGPSRGRETIGVGTRPGLLESGVRLAGLAGRADGVSSHRQKRQSIQQTP
ncbi:hypothetical protein BGZ61DRAFT_471046 [Ilyonectria robusta]|uniref:uncharacterized protein n=1 Tax=Ilyonectria robusta TaxID=1079257 RepID=UPI001E8E8F56|nr:uncharacterized protein BGZ61DRAFT_471046 [Ilyonectria robusta]KAH8737626.1 hypothetical protein BGZ61DRAFT_471046 [Ilyonectria robusta]